MNPIRLEPITGDKIKSIIPALSQLRVSVFREWPYLYEGTADYEAEYLATFAAAAGTVVVAAYDGDEVVGAATAAPLAGHTDEFVPLFRERGYDPETIFYCGESVLLPAYRGRGIGRRFFEERFAHARRLNETRPKITCFTHVTFCGVVRDQNDPRKPAAYRPLDPFWEKCGFEKVDQMFGSYDWCEIGDTKEIAHAMQFWIRELSSEPLSHT